ncbi:MAG: DUF4433 domain-containing protein [Candidatus Scalindua sp.]
MTVPIPTPIYRIIHINNLNVVLRRGGIPAHNSTPNDGIKYRTIHNSEIQSQRGDTTLHCGPCGVMHDYVPFYFGHLSPMLLQLHTGRVAGYDEGQEPIIYLVSTAQTVQDSGVQFVFSDGHGIARYTQWFDDLDDLDKVDWTAVNAKYWHDTVDDMDRQRRKQAEFLVYNSCEWNIISEIGVINRDMKSRVREILEEFPNVTVPDIRIRREWYY